MIWPTGSSADFGASVLTSAGRSNRRDSGLLAALAGALSPNAVRALNKGAKAGGFAHDTGEGGLSPYHRENGGDIIWEIGSGYFGARHPDGTFSPDRFEETARLDQVKMVELKLSQGAKPGHGGVLPAAKVSEEISRIRGVAMGADCISPAYHRAFSTPLEICLRLERHFFRRVVVTR